MIRCQNLVPEYYIENSRDFQVLCRLTDYAFNSLKFNIDTMQSLTNTMLVKDTMLPLVGDKFGIHNEASYTNRDLLKALPTAVRYKGSLKGVKILINAFLDSLHTFEYAVAYHCKDKDSAELLSDSLNRTIQPYSIVILLPISPRLIDLSILDEYIKMVVPCGMIIQFIFGISKTIIDKFKYVENVFIFYTHDNDIGKVYDNDTSYVVFNDTYHKSNVEYKSCNTDDDSTKNNVFISKVLSNIDINTVGNASVVSKDE